MADIGWARSRGDRAEKEGLRRGAWYRIVEDSAELSLEPFLARKAASP